MYSMMVQLISHLQITKDILLYVFQDVHNSMCCIQSYIIIIYSILAIFAGSAKYSSISTHVQHPIGIFKPTKCEFKVWAHTVGLSTWCAKKYKPSVLSYGLSCGIGLCFLNKSEHILTKTVPVCIVKIKCELALSVPISHRYTVLQDSWSPHFCRLHFQLYHL